MTKRQAYWRPSDAFIMAVNDLRESLGDACGQDGSQPAEAAFGHLGISGTYWTALNKSASEQAAKPVAFSSTIVRNIYNALGGSGPDAGSYSFAAGWWTRNSGKLSELRKLARKEIIDHFDQDDPASKSADHNIESVADGHLETFPLPRHHEPSELADFLPRPIPLSNQDEEGRAPLLMKFLFNDVPVRLGGEETEFHLRVNAAKLHLQLTTSATNIADDRVEEALDGSKLRLKALRTLDDQRCGWLIENPADNEQLEGAFDWIHLCYVSQADRANGIADMTVTSGQIAVCQGGRRLNDGLHSKAAKVVQQWAVWAGLGKPDEGEAVYHFSRREIGKDVADDE